jgi:hypothetical protein
MKIESEHRCALLLTLVLAMTCDAIGADSRFSRWSCSLHEWT